MGPIGCPEPSVRNYHYSMLISQKSAVLIYSAAEACNHRILFTQWYIQSATISNLLSLHFASPLFFLSSFTFPSYFLPPYSYHTFHHCLCFFLPCLSSYIRPFILTDPFVFLPFILSVLLQSISPPPPSPPHFTKFILMKGSHVQWNGHVHST
jgi:hypothetical protein